MKPWTWGAAGAVIALALAFGLGRASVPDRTAELIQWRTVADSVGKESAAAEAKADSADQRAAALEARADTAERRARMVGAVADRRGGTILALRDSLAGMRTADDSIPTLLIIVAQQDTVIQDLRAGVRDAADALGGLHADAAVARETLHTANTENARLRGIIAAGFQATKPNRGTGSTLKTLALGIMVGVVGWEVVR